MDRYWEAAGAPQPPPVPATTQGTYPTDGNLPAAMEPSTPGAWWYHQITEEIRNAIVKLGGVPSFTQVDQLANALIASIASAVGGVTQQLAKVAETIPAAQVNADWNASSGLAEILNKPAFQAPLGFTPVQEGGGIGQASNKVYIGWSGANLKATVDTTDLGDFVFEAELASAVANLNAGFSQSVANSFVSAFGGSGYVRIPTQSGTLIMEWGVGPTVSVPYNDDAAFSGVFPLTFPSNCLLCLVSGQEMSGGAQWLVASPHAQGYNASGYWGEFRQPNNGTRGGLIAPAFIAFGN